MPGSIFYFYPKSRSMSKQEKFKEYIDNGYTFKGESVVLGTAKLATEALPNTLIKAPLKTFNRHGLIAGATGTGKTKTLQIIAERLSEHGVGVLLMDIKGDLSGMAAEGEEKSFIGERHEKIGVPWEAKSYPVELLSISDEPGARLRATVSEFGPVLFSKILGLNATQQGVTALVFKYCDDKGLPLLDLKDFRKALQFVSNEGHEEIESEYGAVSKLSVGAIMRKMIELEEQGGDRFFGEKSFDVKDLMRTDEEGLGYINCIRLTDIQDKPKLFSTFMLCLLAEVYETFPEEGDADKPKLVIFIDEAHLIFKEASRALLDQIETIIKLIRSKGVGVFFATQNPTDIPDAVLSQLGMKFQHALRAFTAKDRNAIKQTAENYPLTEYYEVDQVLTELGIGEAFITVLNEKGIPTPLAHTYMRAPASRMDILSQKEIDSLVKNAALVKKYNEEIDRESAYEILNEKLKKSKKTAEKKASSGSKSSRKKKKSVLEEVTNNSSFKIIVRELTRGLLGILRGK